MVWRDGDVLATRSKNWMVPPLLSGWARSGNYVDQSQTLRNTASIILGIRAGPMHLIENRLSHARAVRIIAFTYARKHAVCLCLFIFSIFRFFHPCSLVCPIRSVNGRAGGRLRGL